MDIYSIKNGIATIAFGATTSFGHCYCNPVDVDKLKFDEYEKQIAKEPDEELIRILVKQANDITSPNVTSPMNINNIRNNNKFPYGIRFEE